MPTDKYSLVNPCFDGLWSSALISNKSKSLKSSILSTFAIFTLLFSWVFGYIISITAVVLLLFTNYYTTPSILVLSCLFLPYIFPLKRSPFWCRFLMYGAEYFEGGCSLNFEAEWSILNQPQQPYMLCFHPHGILCLGFIYNGGFRFSAATDKTISPQLRSYYVGEKCAHLEYFPRHGLTATSLAYAPVFKQLFGDLGGCITPANKASLIKSMEAQKSLGITPGAFHEAALFKNDAEFAYILNVKGFIKYALKYGYNLYPSYTFGETLSYVNYGNQLFSVETRDWLSKHRIPSTIFCGPYLFAPIFPYWKNVGLHSVVSKNVIRHPTKIANPTKEQIEHYHQLYVKEIQAVFDRNKWRFGMQDKQLVLK